MEYSNVSRYNLLERGLECLFGVVLGQVGNYLFRRRGRCPFHSHKSRKVRQAETLAPDKRNRRRRKTVRDISWDRLATLWSDGGLVFRPLFPSSSRQHPLFWIERSRKLRLTNVYVDCEYVKLESTLKSLNGSSNYTNRFCSFDRNIPFGGKQIDLMTFPKSLPKSTGGDPFPRTATKLGWTTSENVAKRVCIICILFISVQSSTLAALRLSYLVLNFHMVIFGMIWHSYISWWLLSVLFRFPLKHTWKENMRCWPEYLLNLSKEHFATCPRFIFHSWDVYWITNLSRYNRLFFYYQRFWFNTNLILLLGRKVYS